MEYKLKPEDEAELKELLKDLDEREAIKSAWLEWFEKQDNGSDHELAWKTVLFVSEEVRAKRMTVEEARQAILRR